VKADVVVASAIDARSVFRLIIVFRIVLMDGNGRACALVLCANVGLELKLEDDSEIEF
jgi:hypothetical protein